MTSVISAVHYRFLSPHTLVLLLSSQQGWFPYFSHESIFHLGGNSNMGTKFLWLKLPQAKFYSLETGRMAARSLSGEHDGLTAGRSWEFSVFPTSAPRHAGLCVLHVYVMWLCLKKYQSDLRCSLLSTGSENHMLPCDVKSRMFLQSVTECAEFVLLDM